MTEDKLYETAMQCVELSAEGCSCECNLCEFNIANYISDTKKTALLKATAYTDYISRKEMLNKTQENLEVFNNKKKNILFVVSILIVLCVVIGIVIRGCLTHF